MRDTFTFKRPVTSSLSPELFSPLWTLYYFFLTCVFSFPLLLCIQFWFCPSYNLNLKPQFNLFSLPLVSLQIFNYVVSSVSLKQYLTSGYSLSHYFIVETPHFFPSSCPSEKILLRALVMPLLHDVVVFYAQWMFWCFSELQFCVRNTLFSGIFSALVYCAMPHSPSIRGHPQEPFSETGNNDSGAKH